MNDLTAWLNHQFLSLQSDWRELIDSADPEKIYKKPSPRSLSFGEQIVRSAGAVEQTFDGITANLWDDPFEWTLPENLTSREKLLEYFDEVGITRRRGFELFK